MFVYFSFLTETFILDNLYVYKIKDSGIKKRYLFTGRLRLKKREESEGNFEASLLYFKYTLLIELEISKDYWNPL